jgi:hypothetical protein
MRIQYTLKFGDYLLFNAIHQFLSLPLQLTYLGLASLVFFEASRDDRRLGAFILAFALYLGMWLFQFVFNIVYLYSRRNKALLTNHIVEIQDDAFYEETRYNKSFHYWPGIVRVVSRPGFAAIYITAQSAHIVPARAFANVEQRVRFVTLIQERIRASSVHGKKDA